MKSDSFAQRLRDLRIRQGWTQQEMADRLHMKRSTYAYYEQGGGVPRIELLHQIAEVFGINIRALLPKSDSGQEVFADAAAPLAPAQPVTPTEEYLLRLFRSADPATRTRVLYLLRQKSKEEEKPHAE